MTIRRFEKELAIVARARAAGASAHLARQVTALVQELRAGELYRRPACRRRSTGSRRSTALDRDTLDAGRARADARRRAQGQGRHRSVRGEPAGGRRSRARRRALSRSSTCRFSTICSPSAACCGASGLDVHPGRMLDVAEALQHVNIGSARRGLPHVPRAARASPRGPDRSSIVPSTRSGATTARQRVGERERQLTACGARSSSATDVPHELQRTAASQHAVGQNSSAAQTARIEREVRQRRSHRVALWSGAEILANKDFAEFTADEIVGRAAALTRWSGIPGERRTRRWVRGPRPAHRSAARARREPCAPAAMSSALPRRGVGRRPRPIVLLCDVSGSMERYSRMLLHFAHAIGRRHRASRRSVLHAAHADHDGAARARPGRGGRGGVARGARLVGRYANRRRAAESSTAVAAARAARRPGRPAHLRRLGPRRSGVLREQIARLQRSCHRLIWLNPLIGTADYAPLTRGLQAALPFVDDFLPARTLIEPRRPGRIHLNTARAPHAQFR